MEKLIIRAIDGPARGTIYTIGRGDRLIVGRAPDVPIRFDDPTVSRHHAEIVWSEEAPSIHDLDSRAGVVVNGTSVARTTVRPGDRIRLGATTLIVEASAGKRRLTEGTSEPEESSKPDASDDVVRAPVAILTEAPADMMAIGCEPPADGSPLALLVAQVTKDPGQRLYAIVDGAQAYELALIARRQGAAVYTLFSGDMAVPLAHVGPCLIVLERPLPFLRTWTEAVGRHAGVLLLCTATLDELYAHLRNIFIVTDESGQEYFFRYYDPRVLPTFLPTCTSGQLKEFFGPVSEWIVEDAAANRVLVFGWDGTKVSKQAIALREGEAAAGADVQTV